METSVILKDLREKHKLTQEELAERVLVTRQAVSRWETGETMPNTETLKLLSREYDVSIAALPVLWHATERGRDDQQGTGRVL